MISAKEINILKKYLLKKNLINNSNKFNYPLLENGFTDEDIFKAVEVLLSKKITMGEITKKFEIEFGKFIGSKYALMVNSGSSANLLAAFGMINPKKTNRLKVGDQFLIPSLCWPTSLWPFVQAGLKPKFIDVNLKNFCIEPKQLSKQVLKKSKALVNIHILGNSADMRNIKKIINENNLIMLEDTCEALGSSYNGKYLGTFGDYGTFSFYYSHQITSGEGGMVICKNKEDYEIMNTLRAHGWDRGLSTKNSKSFNFINSGFNLRPLDLTAAIASNQLKRLKQMMKIRRENRNAIIKSLMNSKEWKSQFIFFQNEENIKPSWFGLPLLLNSSIRFKKKKYLEYLRKNNIETRPILTGNFLKQPCNLLYNFSQKSRDFKNTNIIDKQGFFIGLPTTKLSQKKINLLTSKLLNFE